MSKGAEDGIIDCDGCGFGWSASAFSVVGKQEPKLLCPQCVERLEASPDFVTGSIERLQRGDADLREAHELAKVGARQEQLL